MINKKSLTSAFTLIELLVVITIIGILAGIALPVFNSVQIKGAQTKGLAQAKQIGLALKLFAGDNDGLFPQVGTPSGTTGLAMAPTSNVAFGPLFPTYTQSESIFANKRSKWNTVVPDNKIDSPYAGSAGRQDTLKAGENAYGYMMGLSDSANANFPLVFDAPDSTANALYPLGGPTVKGSVWDGTKAIIVFTDNSATLAKVDTSKKYVLRTDDNTNPNILLPVTAAGASSGWCSGCTMLVPE